MKQHSVKTQGHSFIKYSIKLVEPERHLLEDAAGKNS